MTFLMSFYICTEKSCHFVKWNQQNENWFDIHFLDGCMKHKVIFVTLFVDNLRNLYLDIYDGDLHNRQQYRDWHWEAFAIPCNICFVLIFISQTLDRFSLTLDQICCFVLFVFHRQGPHKHQLPSHDWPISTNTSNLYYWTELNSLSENIANIANIIGFLTEWLYW